MPSSPPLNPTPLHPAAQLLARAYSPDTTSRLFVEKVIHKPLILRATSPDANSQDARSARRLKRLRNLERTAKHRQPKRITAREKRKLAVFEIPREQQRYEMFLPLHKLWLGYMREILGLEVVPEYSRGKDGKEGAAQAGGEERVPRKILSAAAAGPVLASADYHGALLKVVRSRSVDRVGIEGLVCKDTKVTFELVTIANKVKVIPKEHTIFQFAIPSLAGSRVSELGASPLPPEHYTFELHGSTIQNRSVDRATKKFKPRRIAEA